MAAEYGFDRASAHARVPGGALPAARSSPRWIARCSSRRNGTSMRGPSCRRSAWRRGVAYWNAHAGDLARAEERYGVPAEIIVAIIGVETFYGRNRGQLPRARRAHDARLRLPAARRVLPRRAEAVPAARARARDVAASARRDRSRARWACRSSCREAIAPMPSTSTATGARISGRVAADIVGSVANYLARHDWQPGRPVLLPAAIADDKRDAVLRKLDGGLSERRAADAWAADGVSVGRPVDRAHRRSGRPAAARGVGRRRRERELLDRVQQFLRADALQPQPAVRGRGARAREGDQGGARRRSALRAARGRLCAVPNRRGGVVVAPVFAREEPGWKTRAPSATARSHDRADAGGGRDGARERARVRLRLGPGNPARAGKRKGFAYVRPDHRR